MLLTKTRKVATELGASVATNGRRPSKKVKPRREDFENRVGSKRTKELVERVATPVVDADEVVFSAKRKQVELQMLHWGPEVRRRQSGEHRAGGLRRKNTETVRTRRHELFDIISHSRPKV